MSFSKDFEEHDSALNAKRVSLASAATIYAVTNTVISLTTVDVEIGAVEIKDATTDTRAVVGANGLYIENRPGTSQMGSVTVSNVVNSIATIAPRTDYLGLASISGNVVNLAGVAQMGSVTISNVVNSIVTVAPRTDYLGLVSVSGSVVNLAGVSQIGSVTISNMQPLVAGTAQVGSVTVSSIGPGTAQMGSVTVSSLGAGVAQVGSVTVSNPINILGTSKTINLTPFCFMATNITGATIAVPSGGKKFYVTNLALSCASVVGLWLYSGATYLVGNATYGYQLAAQSGIVENGSVMSPLYFGKTAEDGLLLGTNTAAPVAGRVTWFEE